MVWAFRGEARKGILTSSNRASLGDAMGMQHAFDNFFTPTVLVKHQRFFFCDSTRETGRERERDQRFQGCTPKVVPREAFPNMALI